MPTAPPMPPVSSAPAPGAPSSPPPARDPSRPQRVEDRPVLRLLHVVDKIIARVWHHTVVLRRPCLPADGPGILVCNHTSHLDPVLIQAVLDRLIVWMMDKNFYHIKAMTPLFRLLEAIPVNRFAPDPAAVRAAVRQLEQGKIVGIFPEGGIENSRELMPFRTGAALLAIKTGVPAYPVFVDGTQRNKTMLAAFVWPNRATLTFGPPVEFDRTSTSQENLQAATARIQAAIEALKGAGGGVV